VISKCNNIIISELVMNECRLFSLICWYQHVSNREVQQIAEQLRATSPQLSRKGRWMMFGHLARMDESAGARRILTAVAQSD